MLLCAIITAGVNIFQNLVAYSEYLCYNRTIMFWNFASQILIWFENYSHVCLSQLTTGCVIVGGGG